MMTAEVAGSICIIHVGVKAICRVCEVRSRDEVRPSSATNLSTFAWITPILMAMLLVLMLPRFRSIAGMCGYSRSQSSCFRSSP